MKQMFRIVLISFVVALSLSSPLIPDVGDVLNEITDITDNVTDAVKAVNFFNWHWGPKICLSHVSPVET